MKKAKSAIIIVLISIFSINSNAQIKINSEPSGAKVFREGKYIGTTPCSAPTNMNSKQLVYDIDANKVRNPSQPPYSIEFTIIMDGYEPATVFFEGKYEYHQRGFGGQNKYYIVQPKTYNLFAVLKKDPNYSNQKSLQESQSEIRWHFDSDPDGARLYWKVKSYTPEVRSTESIYLGSTPFNETKPLNILGLSSENSSNVTIEVEIIKKGYKSQTKSFSAKTLTDQREISWFFELSEE